MKVDKKKAQIREKENRMSESDERVLLLSKPYGIAALVCLFLSLFCIVYLKDDIQSSAFVLAVITGILDVLFLLFVWMKTRNIRNSKK